MSSKRCGLRAAALSYLLVAFVLVSFPKTTEPQERIGAKSTSPSKDDKDKDSVESQLADVRLRLAKAELDRALAANERIPHYYTVITLELLRRNVSVAEARLQSLSRSNETDRHTPHLRELEANLKIAELRWNNAATLPGGTDAAQVEILRLRAEVARLALSQARAPDRIATRLDHMQWQLDQLRQEMLELTLRAEELAHRQ